MKTGPREILLALFESAIAAVAPDRAILRHLKLAGSRIAAGNAVLDIPKNGIKVLGAGKGAAPMAMALENLMGDNISQGFCVVKYGHALKLDSIEIAEAAHPVPDEAGLNAAQKFLETAAGCQPGDLLVCLFTGGASALLPAPAKGLSLRELGETTSLLLASGADIGEINAVRKHLSRIGGGKLAQAANGANILSLIVSDVVGDDLQTIASGPTAPDPTTWQDCLNIVTSYGLANSLPANVWRMLEAGADGKYPETPKSNLEFFKRVDNIIVASNGQALEAAKQKAAEMGFDVVVIAEPMTGEAADMARKLVARATQIRKSLKTGAKNICILAGGETTVTLRGKGKGGRNQEMALMAALELEDVSGIHALFAGTDGTDGPTDAAGGFASGDTCAKIGGHDAALEYLEHNDSYEALKKAGAHLITGPTRTNVMDLALLLVEAPQ